MVSGISGGMPSLSSMYSSMDADSSSSVSLEEFQEMETPEGVSSEDVFNEMDVDGDGYLTESEFTTAMEEKGPPPPPPGEEMSSDMMSAILGEEETSSTEDSFLSLVDSSSVASAYQQSYDLASDYSELLSSLMEV